MQAFDGDLPIHVQVPTRPDLPHSAAANQVGNLVILDDLVGQQGSEK
jgi:hypothetical protein